MRALASVLCALALTGNAQAGGYTAYTLPQGENWYSSWAEGINSSGNIVGAANVIVRYDSFNSPVVETRAVAWSGGAFQYLTPLPDATYSIAHGISDTGIVVGESQYIASNGRNYTYAATWQSGIVRSLGNLGLDNNYSSAYGINAGGIVVGIGSDSTGTHPVIFRGTGPVAVYLSGATPFGGNALFDVNNGGIAAGYSTVHSNGTDYNVAITGDTSSLAFSVLPSLEGGTHTAALRINDAGNVVGFSYLMDQLPHATYWSSGQVTQLDLGLNATSSSATAIINLAIKYKC